MKNILYFIFAVVLVSGCQSTEESASTFRDLNKNGQKDIYEDPSQAIEKRINDLLSQMTIEEKAGLMFNPISGIGMGESMVRVDSLITKVHLAAMDMPGMPTAKEVMEHNNKLQEIAEQTRLGIPITFYSDPRNGLRFNEAAGENRFHSGGLPSWDWPQPAMRPWFRSLEILPARSFWPWAFDWRYTRWQI